VKLTPTLHHLRNSLKLLGSHPSDPVAHVVLMYAHEVHLRFLRVERSF